MKNLNITLVQCPLAWENPAANLANIEGLIKKELKGPTHLIILPEMFSTGFTMKPDANAEKHPGKALAWMQQKAQDFNASITGSVCAEENGNYYNRLYFTDGKELNKSYNKRHLFRMADEHAHYSAGKEKVIIELNGWKIMPLVCYDLRFPVWARNKWMEKGQSAAYDLLLFVANWPEARSYAWKQLLIARAIENQCYVAGVNRVGADGNLIMHSGDSMVVNPLGEIISNIPAHKECVETVTLDMEFLAGLRKKFPVGMDTDNFELKM